MAEALFLVTRASGDEGAPMIDGIFAVVINMDSTTGHPAVITEAVAQCNASKGGVLGASPFGAGYFDTVVVLSDLSGGPLADANDCAIFGGIGVDAAVSIVQGS